MNNFRGGFGGNLGQLMKQAQKMQADMESAKAELTQTDFKGMAGGSAVEVIISGGRKVKSVKINPQVIDKEDAEMLEDLILSALNDALSQIEQAEKEMLPSMPGM